ncbi:MAG: hypothetical protein C0518_15540 [Opitutus sp.]|nr:hypothetical protein [Opitutus sp.]
MSDPSAPLDAALVKEFVTVGHGDFSKVKALLDAQPRLLNATWDWGNGDYETPLGAAAHMGRRDIALFLLERGARADVFALAMLGYVEAVKAMITARPEIARCAGPHGIPLIDHAEKGGAEAAAVVAYLRSLAS